MPSSCPEYENCIQRRETEAEFRGTVNAKLENIETTVCEMRKDIKFFYVKVGSISGGITLLISLIFKALGGG